MIQVKDQIHLIRQYLKIVLLAAVTVTIQVVEVEAVTLLWMKNRSQIYINFKGIY